MKTKTGFSLAEILIALAIMAAIAVFTIPKVMQSTANSDSDTYRQRVKQVASIISAAYGQYRLDRGNVPATTTGFHLTPYMNYVKVDSTIVIDGFYTQGTRSCSGGNCIRFSNGAVVDIPGLSFGNTATTNALYWYVDPNGTGTASGTAPDKSTVLWLYYDGKVIDNDQKRFETYTSWGNEGGPCPPHFCQNPPYFNWN